MVDSSNMTDGTDEGDDKDVNIAVQTDTTSDIFEAMVSELQILRLENLALWDKLSHVLNSTRDDFKDDDKVQFYTGLSGFQVLKILFSF